MSRLLLLAIAVLLTLTAARADPVTIRMYVNPQCGCCEAHAKYLQEHGFKVTMTPTPNMSMIKRQYGVPDKLEGCHTSLVGGDVVEGHVPAATINKLLADTPTSRVFVARDANGSPGMSGTKTEPFTIYELSEGEPKVFGVE